MSSSRAFLFLLLAFIIGVASGSFFDVSEKFVLTAVIFDLVLVSVFYRRGSKIKNFRIAFAGFLFVAFVLGVLRFDASESSTKALTVFNDTGVEVSLSGSVVDEPQRLSDKQRLVVKAKEITASGYSLQISEKIMITAELYPEYEYGDLVLVRGKLVAPKSFDPERSREGPQRASASYGASDFDYAAYLAKDSIFSLSYYPKIEKTGESSFSPFRGIFKAKKVFQDSVSRSIAEPNAAFINGILLGSRENIPQNLKDAFNETGTTHLLAISGYNITVVALYVSILLTFFMRRQKAFWFAVIGIIVFTILTGASASVMRAGVMGILVLIARQAGRFYNPANSIVFAGAAMIVLNPKVLRFDVGFQLSFLATLGLLYLYPLIQRKMEKIPSLWTFKDNLIATISAQLAVLPVILYNFGNFSPVSVPANALILPVIPLAMLLGLLSGISGLMWSGLGRLVGFGAWLVSEYVISVVKLLS